MVRQCPSSAARTHDILAERQQQGTS
jgi:hypothetical protein